jgi:RNA polymerase-binding transcription factor DksA
MATKKPIKKVAKPTAKPAPKKAVAAKPVAKKSAAKAPIVKKAATKAPAKKVAAPAKKATVAPKKAAVPAKKVVAPAKKVTPVVAKKTPVAAKKVAPKAVKPAPKAAVKIAPKKQELKKVVKPAKVEKVVKAEKPVKPPKPPKPPKKVKPPKPVKPAPIVLTAKEIAAKKKAIKEALLKELDKELPPPPPPPVHKRKVEDKNKKPVVIPKVNAKTSQPYNPDFTKSIMDQPKYQSTDPLVRYSDAELNEFKEIINKKLDSARRELAYLQGLITRKDELGGDTDDAHYMTMEDGSISMEREQLSQMAGRQISYIDHLEKAVIRIENKTYGICRVTGKLIDKARLRAVPHATLSIEAKMMQK